VADLKPQPGRWTFAVEAQVCPDHLLRVLNGFVVIGAELSAVAMTSASHDQSIRIEASGLDHRRAETLRARLQALPTTLAVAVVWRTAEQRAAA
jgi:acetolactate synthase regulatory subunit